ncbi:hypothetical protein [Paenibacillus donghaensis]|uniref:Microcin J25-processing protein McjB C-terminal domain-containing protein n=1 Tax=Paenibacillus donghaensis TaxID=414771 RepID=A0A2Z2K5C3_9BACL|nr:hypothetical protein [Paenibacillus donghaensis]ASA21276.1 hypothetical protein B9T62_11060 [Paenibacillus donghaensis]
MEQELHRKIYDSATLFRRAIEKMDISEYSMSPWFNRFPRACCGDASNLLAKYLREQHGVETIYVCGWRKGQSHAWLEYNDLIIDITADQFEEIFEPAVVTTDKTFHSRFLNQKYSDSDFNKFDSRSIVRLRALYVNVLKKINP